MSHFIGLVFVDPMENDLETMLQPYDEDNEDYFEFKDCTKEVEELFNSMPETCPMLGTYTRVIDRTDLVNEIWDKAVDELDEEQESGFWKPYNKKDYPTPADIARDKEYDIVPDDTKRDGLRYEQSYQADWRYEPSKEKYPTIKELAQNYFGYSMMPNGGFGYRHNPYAKYDYYSLGGRWDKYLLTKEGNNENWGLLTAFDWEKMIENNDVPFCFVDTNGMWREKGKMGWWAMTTDEKKSEDWKEEFKSYIQSLLAEAYDEDGKPYEDGVVVYAVDFHI